MSNPYVNIIHLRTNEAIEVNDHLFSLECHMCTGYECVSKSQENELKTIISIHFKYPTHIYFVSFYRNEAFFSQKYILFAVRHHFV